MDVVTGILGDIADWIGATPSLPLWFCVAGVAMLLILRFGGDSVHAPHDWHDPGGFSDDSCGD